MDIIEIENKLSNPIPDDQLNFVFTKKEDSKGSYWEITLLIEGIDFKICIVDDENQTDDELRKIALDWYHNEIFDPVLKSACFEDWAGTFAHSLVHDFNLHSDDYYTILLDINTLLNKGISKENIKVIFRDVVELAYRAGNNPPPKYTLKITEKIFGEIYLDEERFRLESHFYNHSIVSYHTTTKEAKNTFAIDVQKHFIPKANEEELLIINKFLVWYRGDQNDHNSAS